MSQTPASFSLACDRPAVNSACPDQRAQAALASSPVVELRDLTVVQTGENLLISGRVNCFYHKQLAQETVRPFANNLRMVNDVSVEWTGVGPAVHS